MRILMFFAVFCFAQAVSAQNIYGFWKNIDDEDGEEKSIIEVYEEDGHVYGRVVRLLESADLTHCPKCPGDKKDAPLVGMVIMWDLHAEKNGKKATGGQILDPKTGKEYDCKISMENNDVLKVRGYIGAPFLGRTQKWYRVAE